MRKELPAAPASLWLLARMSPESAMKFSVVHLETFVDRVIDAIILAPQCDAGTSTQILNFCVSLYFERHGSARRGPRFSCERPGGIGAKSVGENGASGVPRMDFAVEYQ